MPLNLFRVPHMNWMVDRAMRQSPEMSRALDAREAERGETRTGTIQDYMPRSQSRGGGITGYAPRAYRRGGKRQTRG